MFNEHKPERSYESKRFITKVVVAAVTTLSHDFVKKQNFNGKVEFRPFVHQ